MWWWVAIGIASVMLNLQYDTVLAAYLGIGRVALDGFLLVLVVSCVVCFNMRRAKKRRAALTKVGQLIDADLDQKVSRNFLERFDSPPWQLWDQGSIRVNHVFFGKKTNPEFWVFDLEYLDTTDDWSPYYRMTFIAVALSALPGAQVRTPTVPKGFTAMVSQNFLYLYETAMFVGVNNFMLLDEIPAAVDKARAMAKVTPAGNGNPAWAEKQLFQ